MTMAVSLPHHSSPEENWYFSDVSCAPVTTTDFYYAPMTTTSCASSETSSDYSPAFNGMDWSYMDPWNDGASNAPSVSPSMSHVDYYSSREYSPVPLFPPSTAPSSQHLSVPTPLPSPGIHHSETRTFHCQFPSCTAAPADRVFTRKSDWRRHTDKHTRPYRCTHASCVDLPGFSWPGGLNRHLEEQHTAASQRHRCPYTDCKRHEKGFNRCWNLKNHIKKVHNKKRKEVVIEELKRVEREVTVRKREEIEARRRREMAFGRLQELRGSLISEDM